MHLKTAAGEGQESRQGRIKSREQEADKTERQIKRNIRER